jgi:hypothetical protein
MPAPRPLGLHRRGQSLLSKLLRDVAERSATQHGARPVGRAAVG